MNRPVPILLAVTAIAAAAAFFLNFEIEGWKNVKLTRRVAGTSGSGPSSTATHLSQAGRSADDVRLAVWDMQGLDLQRLEDPHTMELLARHFRHFDLLTLQNVAHIPLDRWQKLLQLGATEHQALDVAVGPPTGPADAPRHCVLVFDRNVLRLDRQRLQTVHDPDGLFTHDPLIARFGTTAASSASFTFVLLSVWIDRDALERELAALDELYYAVRDSGGGEDDIILAGNLQASAQQIHEVFPPSAVQLLVQEPATDVRGETYGPQIVIDPRATCEFTGRRGAWDTLRQENLTLAELDRLSPWMPVWAEFTRLEGAVIARRQQRGSRQSHR